MGEPNYKLLDCDKKALLCLPPQAVNLWLAYFMHEDMESESFMSLPTIMELTGWSRRSIIDWTAWLVARGWLVDTGKTAADKWIAMGRVPTRGAWQVHVYRAVQLDSPTNMDNSLVQDSAPVRISAPKVLFGSGSAPLSSSSLSAVRIYSAKEKYPQRRGAIQNQRENLEPKPKPKTKGDLKFEKEHGGITRAEWDDHDQAWHTEKLIELGISREGVLKSNGNANAKANSNGHGKESVNKFLNAGNPIQFKDMTAADLDALEKDMFGDPEPQWKPPWDR